MIDDFLLRPAVTRLLVFEEIGLETNHIRAYSLHIGGTACVEIEFDHQVREVIGVIPLEQELTVYYSKPS